MPDSFQQLGLTQSASPKEVRERYLKLASVHHPDKGGSPEAFTSLQAAYRDAYRRAHERKCDKCGGIGRVLGGTGVRRVEVMCDGCRGTGKANRGRG